MPYAIKKTAKGKKCIEQGALGDLSSVLMAAKGSWRSNTVISSNQSSMLMISDLLKKALQEGQTRPP